MIKIRRMCGGGVRSCPWTELRHVDGAVIWDRPGWALAWRGDWGRARLPRWLSPSWHRAVRASRNTPPW